MSLSVRCISRLESGFDVDVDFVSDHRVTALFGPSGAGKTSLLMMIAGFMRPDAGRISWNDRLLLDTASNLSIAPEKRHLGVVFQDQRLFPHLSVEANLCFGAHRRTGGRRPLDLKRVAEVLDLRNLLDRGPETLSGGERQRVALGRALMSAPELLLMDEPVAAVDERRRGTILRYVERVVEEWNTPMLYVSHHRPEVQRLADWVIAIDGGRVAEQGEPDRILGAGELVQAGEAVNLLRLEVNSRDGEMLTTTIGGDQNLSLRVRAAGRHGDGGGSIFVQFAASDVMLARGNIAGLSARNQLPATIVELVPRSGRVFAALDLGDQRIWAEITDEAVAELELESGIEVTCLIKSAALRVLE